MGRSSSSPAAAGASATSSARSRRRSTSRDPRSSAFPATTSAPAPAARSRFGAEAARSTPRLHRPDERPARRGRRPGPLDRGPDRPRGPDPRLSGDLLRLRRRPHPRQQPARMSASGSPVWRLRRASCRPRSARRWRRDPEPDPSFAALPSPATLAIEARPRVKPRRVARMRAGRCARGIATAALRVGAFLTDYAYPLFAKPSASPPPSRSPPPAEGRRHRRRARGLGRATRPPAPPRRHQRLLRVHRDARASTRSRCPTNGDEAIPILDGGGPFHSLGTKGRLTNAATGSASATTSSTSPRPTASP